MSGVISTGASSSIQADGWVRVASTWTYASATSITVPSGAASVYQKGDRIKLTQTTTKYFYVVAVADTALTITGGDDYTLANAAITNPYYSHQISPVGFPNSFTWTPTQTGFSAAPASPLANFTIIGNTLFGVIRNTANGTSNATTYTITNLPVTAARTSSWVWFGFGVAIDNGSTNSTPGRWSVAGAGTTITFFKAADATAFTASGAKAFNCEFFYEI